MDETGNLGLPLVQPAQAQKHVTVNESLARLDGVTQMRALSRTVAVPPGAANEGAVFLVPAGAVNAWAGQEGKVAIWSNGGWVFLAPQPGWRCFIVDETLLVTYIAGFWQEGVTATGPHGCFTQNHVLVFDQLDLQGSYVDCDQQTPDYAMVLGVTARVLSDVTGTFSEWRLGVNGSSERYASGMGTAAGSWIYGISGRYVSYYNGYQPRFTAVGGDFTGGSVRVAVHYTLMSLPDGD